MPQNMNVYARFDEIPSMTLQDIKERKCYARTYGCENSIPPTNTVCRGYKNENNMEKDAYDI